MKIRSMSVFGLLAVAPLGALAESHDEPAPLPTIVPVETYTCDFNDGKAMPDLMRVIDEFNDWADDQDITGYYAAVVTPQFFGELAFDVAWLGAARDGNAMGKVQDAWVNEGDRVADMFNEVISCGSHTQFASMAIRPPGDDEENDKTFVLTFSNCSAKEGKSFADVIDGMNTWAAYQAENGFGNATWMMFPVYGESDDDYDFKVVEGYDDYAVFGSDFELMGNGGHWQKSGEIFDGLLDCDIARVYDARTVRQMEDED